MPSSVAEEHGGHRRPAPDISERSPLTKHPDSAVVYGISSGSSSSTDDDGASLGLGSDEEALLGATLPEDPVSRQTPSPAPLTTKTILWIVLPMMLG